MSDDLKLDRPFALFIQEDIDEPGCWTAHAVGFELDNMTFGDGPLEAAYMAFDMLCALANVDPKAVIAALDAKVAAVREEIGDA